jgi:hypothetical protein
MNPVERKSGAHTPAKSTPRPWRYREHDRGDGYVVCGDIFVLAELRFPEDETGKSLVGFGHEEPNAALIVKAVNEREDLVKALERMAFYAALLVDPDAHGTYYPADAMRELEEARAALQKASQP